MSKKKRTRRKAVAELLVFGLAIALMVVGAKILLAGDLVTGIICVWLSGMFGCFWCVLE